VQVIAAHASRLVPGGAHVLDVGTGDGRIAATLGALRPDLRIEGVDVLVRADAAIPVTAFDGRAIPRPSRSVDVVTMFDVVHHAEDPGALLSEASRVARSCVILKDHVASGWYSRAVLAFMDEVGNRRHGVALPHHYLSAGQWTAAIARAGLTRALWDVGGLGLYPWPASVVFGSRLHVLARLNVEDRA